MNDAMLVQAPTSLSDILDMTAADRSAVDRLIRARLRSDVVLVNQVGEHIISAGGKRLRPLVHLLAARASGYRGTAHVQLAAVIEFIHTATLLHDDVVDGSQRRRGRAAAHRVWGNSASVLVGDFLYSRSFQMMVELEAMQIMSILADATNTIAAGEVLQLMHLGNPDLDEAAYVKVIGDKTACLFSAAARLGAVLADAGPERERQLAIFGHQLGQAFQITDDLLDYTSDEATMGKNLGDDLAEGKVTLPLILALNRADTDDRAFLREIIRVGGTTEMGRVRAILEATDALKATHERALDRACLAQKALTGLPDTPEREALNLLTQFAVDRTL